MTASPKILIAGIGNIFLGDDAFGVRVAELLARNKFNENIRLVDFGIRGLDLAYTLLEDWHTAILIDAVPQGHAPGTLYVIEPEIPDDAGPSDEPALMQGHSLDPASVLRLVTALGGKMPRLILVGCEPAPIDPDADIQMELTPAVQSAIEPAARMVESIVSKILVKPLSMENQNVHDYIGSRA